MDIPLNRVPERWRSQLATAEPSNGASNGQTMHKEWLIDADEFCRLAISARKLVRVDDPARGVRGLHDLETGERFFVEERVLFMHGIT